MAVFRDEVAVLKVRDFGEYDKILTLFGKRQGKFGAIAKGIRKFTSRKRGHLETFSLARVSCGEGKTLHVVSEAECYFFINPKEISSKEFELIGFAGFVLDKFLPDNVIEPKVFALWETYLKGVHDEDTTNKFVLQVLVLLGFIAEHQFAVLDKFARTKSLVYKLLDTI